MSENDLLVGHAQTRRMHNAAEDAIYRVLVVLEDRGFKNAKIKKPCVTADYAGDNVHIDLIIYKRSGDEHWLAVGKKNSDEDNREWSESDPLGLIEWINDDSEYWDDPGEERAQFRRVVRYLKRWRDVQFSEAVAAKVYSIGLTVMAKEQFASSFSIEGAKHDLAALRDTVATILDGGYFDEEASRIVLAMSTPIALCCTEAQPGATVYTDGAKGYKGIPFRHELVRHSSGEYVRGDVHTQGIESF